MDELGFTKIAAAVLATALGVMVIRTLPEMLMHSEYPATPAYSVGPIEVVDTGDAEPLPFPQPEWVAAMDATRGAKVFKKCTSCHNVEAGGANSTGPNLHDIVGKAPAQKAGFNYSQAMKDMDTEWSYEQLDAFLTKPAKYLSGTKMAFVGLKKAEDRAAVIEYLRLSAANPMAQPEPVVAEVMEVPTETVTLEEETVPAEDATTDQKKLSQEEQKELQ